ncbi:GNAT family N-acetyltransferase [Dysgonomonas capnocytophagoides]|uniref:GNAT family N-acetyltransferase n=1 Tax=Dysgonomonas capnocytophagoides TaxID=45254 RepID=UPI0030C83E5E
MMINDIVIKKADPIHIDELELLYDELNDYFTSTVNYPGWIKHIYPTRETAINGIKEKSLFVAQINDTIVGSIILNHIPEEAYDKAKWIIATDYKDVLVIRTLVVHPLYLNKGIATTLLQFTKQYALNHQNKSIRLDVSENNLPAVALYKKMGYKYIDTVDLGLPYEHLKWFQLYELSLV